MIKQMAFILIEWQGVNMNKEDLKKEGDLLNQSLKDDEINRFRKKQSEMKAEALSHAVQSRSEESRQVQLQADKEWETLRKMTSEAKEPQKGYDNWLASMSSVLAICRQLQLALSLDNPLRSLVRTVYQTIAPYGGMAWDKFSDTINNALSDDPAVTLPNLMHFVEYTPQNTLKVESLTDNLTRSDGKPFTQEQKQILDQSFPAGVKLWLDQNDYTPDPAVPGHYVHKVSGTELTKDKFEELRDDPHVGLNTFLSGSFQLNVKQASEPPRP